MSTDVMVKFYLNGEKKIGSACINILKNLMDGWNFSDELRPIENKKENDANENWYENFLGYLPKNANEAEVFAGRIKNGELHLERNETFDKAQLATLEQLNADKNWDEKYYKVFDWERSEIKGEWYDINAFEKAEEKFRFLLAKAEIEFWNLKRIKESVDYYKLDSDAKEDYLGDLEAKTEEVAELNDRIYACRYLADTLEMLTDMNGKYSDETLAYIYFA